jgi:hypothetical protein
MRLGALVDVAIAATVAMWLGVIVPTIVGVLVRVRVRVWLATLMHRAVAVIVAVGALMVVGLKRVGVVMAMLVIGPTQAEG